MALIFTKEQIQAQKEAHYKKLKKQGENMDTSCYSLRIPRHIALKFRKKLLDNGKNMKEVLMEYIIKYIE